jgi:thymidine kinase
MFIEPKLDKGGIEVICGSMFSGKTEELIRRMKRAVIANQKVQIFKPAIDTRYHEMHVVSHDKNMLESIPVQRAKDILDHLTSETVIGIDEAQFFDEELVGVCKKLTAMNKRVIVAGLDMDSNGVPFGPMPYLMATAEYVTKVHAICMQCGNIATFTFKRIKSDKQVELGAKELYEARCRSCFEEGMIQQREQLNLNFDK